MADRESMRRQLAQARNVFKQFRDTPQLKEISETYLAFEPEDREDHDFAEALGWALITITRQGILLAAHDAVGGAVRYRARVQEISESLLRQINLECDWPSPNDPAALNNPNEEPPPAKPSQQPRTLPSHLRVIPGGKGKTGSG